jgi:hypothetical protein
VTTPRGTLPGSPSSRPPLGDTVWVVPLVVFWQVVLQDPIMPKGSWRVEAQQHSTREASPEELGILHRHPQKPKPKFTTKASPSPSKLG